MITKIKKKDKAGATTILVVDDTTNNLYLMQALLQGNGYAVMTAENGVEALETARRSPPALIISDVLMPVMDGFALCREWKKDPALNTIPFLFCTATYTSEKDEQFALHLGADLFIAKPVELQVILDGIRNLLGSGEIRRMSEPDATGRSDITYLKEYNATLVRKLEDKVEELGKANGELRAIDRLKTNLLRNVSHELHTPLMIVSGYVELLAQGRSGPVTETQGTQFKAIQNNMDRLLHLVNNLIFAADPAGQKKDRTTDSVELNDIFNAIREVIRFRAQEKSIALDIAPSTAIVSADQNELLQAVYNLLDNAVKFTPAGGRVTVSTIQIADKVRISFIDTGIGIPPSAQQHIFDGFYQVDGSTTRSYRGLGLGLSIVKEIAERHAGRIELVSEPEKGSVFTLILPAAA